MPPKPPTAAQARQAAIEANRRAKLARQAACTHAWDVAMFPTPRRAAGTWFKDVCLTCQLVSWRKEGPGDGDD